MKFNIPPIQVNLVHCTKSILAFQQNMKGIFGKDYHIKNGITQMYLMRNNGLSSFQVLRLFFKPFLRGRLSQFLISILIKKDLILFDYQSIIVLWQFLKIKKKNKRKHRIINMLSLQLIHQWEFVNFKISLVIKLKQMIKQEK